MNRSHLTKKYLDERLVLPSHQARSQMAMEFNRKLKEKCEEMDGIYFIEIASEIMDEKTEIVQQKFVKQKEKDIHLEPNSLIPIYHEKLKELGLDFAIEIDAKWDALHRFERELKQRLEFG